MTGRSANKLLVDGHVHLYPCFDPDRFLAAALSNLSAAAHRIGGVTAGALLFTETARDSAFNALTLGALVPSGWTVESAEGDPALVLRSAVGGLPLVIVAGRQIQTKERIEVLAVGSDAPPPPDGTPLADVLATLAVDGVPMILPWGVGKWMGERGRIVARTFAETPGLLAGDNAGRPLGWRAPEIFSKCPVLPGSDPLPYPGAETNVGSYGFVLDGPVDLSRPGATIRERLCGLAVSPPRFGNRAGPVDFVSSRVRFRLAKGKRISQTT